MELNELKNIYTTLLEKVNELWGSLDTDKINKEIKELEDKMSSPNFWDDKKNSERVIQELNSLKNQLDSITSLKNDLENDLEMISMLEVEYDDEMFNLLKSNIQELENRTKNEEVSVLLNGPYDKEGAILEIHPGAGGTESCDWANMLSRMYQRFFDKKGFKYELIDEQAGEEAGIKSVTFLVKGINAYGYLKSEIGVHRLVRISPFDSNSRRHTSFASVSVSPLFESNDIDIEINDNDIRIDVYRSSGCGGQGVNTTDSAVRITHFPSKIVVTCQNERSQIQNKEKAMEVLKNKLYELELQKKEKEMKELKGELSRIDFGSQIRSYVMCPYSMVKDHRTNYETSNVTKVLDGDIDNFINEYLLRGR
ncbi:MAG: peptide chain release factor 2 [Bacilli bacterium]|nr:peptide chain release factor 2 [Bacilli bacterium]